MGLALWASAPSREQLFVLVTGANRHATSILPIHYAETGYCTGACPAAMNHTRPDALPAPSLVSSPTHKLP